MSRDQKASIVHELHTHNVNIDSREVFVHGYIGDLEEDPGIEWRIANNFLKNLRLLEGLSKQKLIVVHQFSDGGDWSAGIMMYDAILSCEAPVLYVMWGQAASMGSIIPQAADKRIVSPSCNFMVHDGETSVSGSYKQAQSQVVFEKRMKAQMMDIYSSACVTGEYFCDEYSEDDVKNFIEEKLEKKEDWWMSADEAVEYGFADGVLGTPGFETILDVKNDWEDESE